LGAKTNPLNNISRFYCDIWLLNMLSGKKHSTTTVAQSVFTLPFHTKN